MSIQPILPTDIVRDSREVINTNFQNLNSNKSEKTEIQNSSLVYAIDTGVANNYVVALTPAITAYVEGLKVVFRAANPNTGASTLNVNGLGVRTIRKLVAQDLAGGEITSGAIVSVVFDGTNFQIEGIVPGTVYTTGDQTIGGVKTFSSVIEGGIKRTEDTFTYGETIAVNDALYLRASDGRVLRTSASFNDERIHNFIGFAKEVGVNGEVRRVQTGGVVEGFTGLVVGVNYFLSNTAGAIGTTAGTNNTPIGIAISATRLLLHPMIRKKYVDDTAMFYSLIFG